MNDDGEFLQFAADSQFMTSGAGATDFRDSTGHRLTEIGPLRALNILVGANNSGKSRFLRGLAKMRSLVVHEQSNNYGAFMGVIEQMKRLELPDHLDVSLRGWLPGPDDQEFLAFRTSATSTPLDRRNVSLELEDMFLKGVLRETMEDARSMWATNPLMKLAVSQHVGAVLGGLPDAWSAPLKAFFAQAWPRPRSLTSLERKIASSGQLVHPGRTYYPHLRTAWPFPLAKTSSSNDTDRDFIRHAIVEQYGFQDAVCVVHSGLHLYEQMRDARDGDASARSRFRAFEGFIKDQFFAGATSLEIVARAGTDRSISVTIDGVERKLPELGDGIVAIVILAFPMFMANEGDWFFIEV
jgi:hypothetical protein